MNDPTQSRSVEKACLECGQRGRPVPATTLEALVSTPALTALRDHTGFRFCANPLCDTAYFRAQTGERVPRGMVKVRIGQKETEPPIPVCYCFGFSAEQIEADVHRTGTSSIPEIIREKCRQGLDRCERTNPQGRCCLGNVRAVLARAGAGGQTRKDESRSRCCDEGVEE